MGCSADPVGSLFSSCVPKWDDFLGTSMACWRNDVRVGSRRWKRAFHQGIITCTRLCADHVAPKVAGPGVAVTVAIEARHWAGAAALQLATQHIACWRAPGTVAAHRRDADSLRAYVAV